MNEGRAPGTVKKIVAYWSALFSFAEPMEWLASNPRKVLKRRGAGKAVVPPEERQDVSDHDLERLFAPQRVVESFERDRPERYWLPLLDVRRKFIEAEHAYPREAGAAVAMLIMLASAAARPRRASRLDGEWPASPR